MNSLKGTQRLINGRKRSFTRFIFFPHCSTLCLKNITHKYAYKRNKQSDIYLSPIKYAHISEFQYL